MGESRWSEGLGGRVLDSLAWGVMVVGRRSKIIHHYNSGMARIAGLQAEAARGNTLREVFGGLGGLDLDAAEREIDGQGFFETRNLRLVRPDGEVVFRHIRGDVLQSDAGGEDGVVVSVQDVTDREQMRLCLSRYLAQEVAEFILASRPDSARTGREVEVAVLVADMRNFTAAAEGLTPEELFDTLNAYLEPMVEVVVQHRGIIDKFTGDGFMAVFGVPVAHGDEAQRALAAALALQQAVSCLHGEREAQGLPAFHLGYGVHWGVASAGSLGSEVRMEYTVVGDTVNVAHRLQALALPGQVLATRETARQAADGFHWGPPRWVRVKGRKAPLQVLALEGRLGARGAGCGDESVALDQLSNSAVDR